MKRKELIVGADYFHTTDKNGIGTWGGEKVTVLSDQNVYDPYASSWYHKAPADSTVILPDGRSFKISGDYRFGTNSMESSSGVLVWDGFRTRIVQLRNIRATWEEGSAIKAGLVAYEQKLAAEREARAAKARLCAERVQDILPDFLKKVVYVSRYDRNAKVPVETLEQMLREREALREALNEVLVSMPDNYIDKPAAVVAYRNAVDAMDFWVDNAAE